MEPFSIIGVTLLFILGSAYFLGLAVRDLKKERYFSFGMYTMLVILFTLEMAKRVFEL